MAKADTIDVAGRRGLVGLLAAILLIVVPVNAADLKLRAVQGFDRYVQITEAQIDSQAAREESFLRVESLPEERRAGVYAQLRDGKVVIERLETLNTGKKIAVPGGLIHHW